jgi:isopenicillin-N epimerase
MACEALHHVLARNSLQAIAPDRAYGQMVPIPVRTDDPDGLRRQLFDEHHIEIPVTQHAGRTFVRLSVQAYNTQAEVDQLIAAMEQLGLLKP